MKVHDLHQKTQDKSQTILVNNGKWSTEKGNMADKYSTQG